MTPTEERERAIALAHTDPAQAREVASGIADPWFRAQAQAWIAWLGPEEAFGDMLRESQASVVACVDPYQVVASAAWPLRAAIERQRKIDAAAFLGTVLPTVEHIANPVSRMDALFLVWQAAIGLDQSDRDQILQRLLSASAAADSWKAGFTLRELALMVAKEDPVAAQAVVESMPDGQHRRQAVSRLANGECLSPRPFFWRGAAA